jgi:hypothetical protein
MSIGKRTFLRLARIALVLKAGSMAGILNVPLRAQSDVAAPARSLTTLLTETPEELPLQLLNVKRIFVDRLTGGETAAQMRDLVISSLQGAKLFILTENEGRADAFLRGAAEDLIYVDSFQSSDGINAHVGAGENDSVGTSTRFNGAGGGSSRSSGRNINATIGEHESVSEKERKHEALATVRIVNKDGDVIWTTTQESNGAKFRGASADVAEKITRQLVDDVAKLRRAGSVPRH